MSTKTNNAKIGVFVIVAVLILVLGLLAFGAKTYFVQKTKIETAIAGEVYGLSVGSGVQLRGVPIGKVTDITFSWHAYPQTKTNLIVVVFEVEAPLLPLPKGMDLKSAIKKSSERGLRAIVRTQGITGTSILALETLNPEAYPPPAIDYTPKHPYVPSAPPQLTRLVESLGKSLNHLQELDFASIGKEATNTLATVREMVAKLNQVDIAALNTNANDLLVELKASSAKLGTTIDRVQKTFDNLKLETVTTNANGLIADVRVTNQKLQTVLDKADTVPLQQTAADLQQILRNLDEVLANLKEYPSGFIFGKPPRPVEALERSQK